MGVRKNGPDAAVFPAASAPVFVRGPGTSSSPAVSTALPGASFFNGFTTISAGTSIPTHVHNCEEAILIVEGSPTFVVGDEERILAPGDVTWCPADVPHCFRNHGEAAVRIFWTYVSPSPTRTIVATGHTFPIGSAADYAKPPR
jgi:putative monooxygenase